jgi:ethanolamine ammonia-lyase small subunit
MNIKTLLGTHFITCQAAKAIQIQNLQQVHSIIATYHQYLPNITRPKVAQKVKQTNVELIDNHVHNKFITSFHTKV